MVAGSWHLLSLDAVAAVSLGDVKCQRVTWFVNVEVALFDGDMINNVPVSVSCFYEWVSFPTCTFCSIGGVTLREDSLVNRLDLLMSFLKFNG